MCEYNFTISRGADEMKKEYEDLEEKLKMKNRRASELSKKLKDIERKTTLVMLETAGLPANLPSYHLHNMQC